MKPSWPWGNLQPPSLITQKRDFYGTHRCDVLGFNGRNVRKRRWDSQFMEVVISWLQLYPTYNHGFRKAQRVSFQKFPVLRKDAYMRSATMWCVALSAYQEKMPDEFYFRVENPINPGYNGVNLNGRLIMKSQVFEKAFQKMFFEKGRRPWPNSAAYLWREVYKYYSYTMRGWTWKKWVSD